MTGDRFVRSVSIDWDRVPEDAFVRRVPALAHLETLSFDRNVTFFAGDNGTGKSTLLEAIAEACGFNPEGGTRNYHFSTWREEPPFGEALRLVRGTRRNGSGYFFRAETFFNMATAAFTEYNDGSEPDLHARSHGESFLDYLGRYQREGLYLMDEPEAALSPQRQLTLLVHIHALAEKGAQFLIATHSPILLGLTEARILSFDGEEIHPAEYGETESVRITRLFLDRREQVLRELFRPDP